MGTTCVSLHLLRPAGGADAIARDLRAAYAKIGYAAAKKATEGQSKQVVVADDGQGEFLSIHDSDCDQIDTGDLKDIAVALTKRLKTTAVLTSVFDSDQFEFVVFHVGKQVDAVVSDPESHAGGLKMLSPAKRATAWINWFLVPQVQRMVLGLPPGTSGADRMALLMERQRAFEARLKATPTATGVFAEETLAAWCEAAGLSPAPALTTIADLAEDATPATARLSFVKSAVSAAGAAAGTLPTAVRLSALLDDDHCPYQRMHPAAWPVAPDATERVQWLALSAGAAISGLSITLDIDDGAGLEVRKIEVAAYPFYNGQMTSATPIAMFQQAAPALPPTLPCRIAVAPFDLPALDPQTRKQIVIILVVELALTAGRSVSLRPVIAALSPASESVALPPVRLRAGPPAAVPLVAERVQAEKARTILRLGEPAVLSMVAMLNDDGAPVRHAVRAWIEAWFTTLRPPEGTELTVRTEKHMTASFRVTKAAKAFPFQAATADKAWARLFDPAADYHTVMLGLVPPGAAHPIAGVTLQAALRDGLRSPADQAADIRQTIAKQLPPASREAGGLSTSDGCALSFAPWVVNDPAAFEALGTSPAFITAAFADWLDGLSPIQGWIARAAWIPEFDLYDNYNQTLYEQASSFDWFRSGLNGMLASHAWLSGRVRFVTPDQWLSDALVAALDLGALRAIADVAKRGPATRITLHGDRTLRELEIVLRPILPLSASA